MIKKLKKIIDQEGMTWVANKLGYRSMNTIYKWLQEKRVPKSAQQKVKDFIGFYENK